MRMEEEGGRRGSEGRRRGRTENFTDLGDYTEGEDEYIVCLQVSIYDVVLVEICQSTRHLQHQQQVHVYIIKQRTQYTCQLVHLTWWSSFGGS